MNIFCTNRTNSLHQRTNIFTAALTALLLFTSTASHSGSDHGAILDEFSTQFEGVPRVGMIVSDNDDRRGIHLFGVTRTTSDMCNVFSKVDSSVQYVIVNRTREDDVAVQLFQDCR